MSTARSGAFHQSPGHPAPFGPGAVVDPDAVPAEQVGQDEPGGAGTAADRAVRDQLGPAVEVDGGEDGAQGGRVPERPPLVVQAVDGLVDRGGDVTGAATGLEAAGGPEPLALVLLHRTDIQQRSAGAADRVPDGRVTGLQSRGRCRQDVAGYGGLGRLAAYRMPLVAPGPARAVEDAHVLVAVEPPEPEAEGGRGALGQHG